MRALLGLGFTFVEEDWDRRKSYQFPQAWSGQALLEILEILAAKHPVDPHTLYLFGVSAGAQFATRFALMSPDISKAVAAHAAGGYDLPQSFVATRFLVTVGELDNEDITRVDMAKEFYEACKAKGINVDLVIVPRVAHRQTKEQDEMSRQFFKKQALS